MMSQPNRTAEPPGMLLLFRYHDPRYYGGIERKILSIAAHFRTTGSFQPILLSNHDASPFARDFAALGCPVHRCDMSGPTGLLKAAAAAEPLLGRYGVTLVQSHRFWTSLAGAMIKRRHPELRHVHRVHTHIEHSEIPAWRQRAYHCLDRFAQRYIDRYVVLHDGLARELRERSCISPGKITVVPNGIPPLGPEPPPEILAEPLPRSIVIVGELEPRKRQEHAIRAIAELRRGARLDVSLFLVGGDTFGYATALRDLAATLDVADLVHFLGFRQDIDAVLAGKGLVALTSDFEGIPTSIIEAMSIGMLVLATDVGGTRDLVLDRRNGFLVPAGDWLLLAERLREIFAAPPGTWTGLRRAALATYRRGYTVPVMMAGLESVYRELGVLRSSPAKA